MTSGGRFESAVSITLNGGGTLKVSVVWGSGGLRVACPHGR